MGLIVSVFRAADRADCTSGGISSRASRLCLVNVPGPFKPSEECPAAMLMPNVYGTARIVPCVKAEPVAGGPVNFDGWQAAPGWHMMGGNYAFTSDSRFSQAVEALTGARFFGTVPIHDRQE